METATGKREASSGFERTPLFVASEGRKDTEAGAEMLGHSHSIVGAQLMLGPSHRVRGVAR